MKHLSITPNLIVDDMARSIAFYRDVLGFNVQVTVPEQAPFVFAWMASGSVAVFLNDRKAAAQEMPDLAARPTGGPLSLYLKVEGIDEIFNRIKSDGAKVVMPMKTQFYGEREFAFEDPSGWTITVAEEIAAIPG